LTPPNSVRINTVLAIDSNLNATFDTVTANDFIGDGSQLYNLIAGNVEYEPNGLGLTATNVQAAIDELQLKKLDISALTSSVTFFATDAASNVSGYYKLVTSTSDPDYDTTAVDIPTGAITGDNQLIASLASEPGVLEGNTTPINTTTIGKVRKTAGGESQNAEFYYEIYKRDASNVETLIGTSSTTGELRNDTYLEFSANDFIDDTNFTETDRVVIKFYGNNIGDGAPAYDFQFGGSTPVRTLFPVPVSVVPVDHTADVVTTVTSEFDGILSGADDTVQKALETIDEITTTVIPEGTNQYFTTDRANVAIELYEGDMEAVGTINAVELIATGDVTANAFIGDGSQLTGIVHFTTDDANVAIELYDGDMEAVGTINALELIVEGDVSANSFIGDGSQLTGITSYSNVLVANYLANSISTLILTDTNFTNDVFIEGGLETTADIDTVNIQATGDITANAFIGDGSQLTGLPASYGNAEVEAFLESGDYTTDIEIQGSFIGDGSQLTGISTYGNADVANYLANSEVITVSDLEVTADIYVQGSVTADEGFSTTADVSAASMSVTGNINAGNVIATAFIGDGSQLTGISGGSYGNAEVEAFLESGNYSTDIEIQGQYIGDGSQLTGITAEVNVTQIANQILHSQFLLMGA